MKKHWRISRNENTASVMFAAIALLGFASCAVVSLWVISNSLLFNVCIMETYLSTHGHEAFSSHHGWFFFRPGLACMVKSWNHADRNMRSICALNDSLRKSGVQLFVVPVPDKETIIQDYSPFNVAVASNQRKRFLKNLEKHNVRVIDMVPVFMADRHKDLLYRKDDTHWDQRGISLCAEKVASAISLPPERPGGPGYILKDTVVFSQGDLSNTMLDSAFHQRKCTMVLTNDSLPCEDLPESDIMIFGDSFSRTNKQWSGHFGAWMAYYSKRPDFTYTNLSACGNGPQLLRKFIDKRVKLPKEIIWVFASRYLLEDMTAY